VALKYFEDVRPGESDTLGSHTFTETEIIAFARKYDPQPFHIDPEVAKSTMFGGLIASGWHTCAIMMRMTADTIRRNQLATTGSPGVDSCRWLKPVRPGDTLTGRSQVLEAWPSRSKPFGFVRSRIELLNQRGEIVLSLVGLSMYRRRESPA
jgi:acyl dehydratase